MNACRIPYLLWLIITLTGTVTALCACGQDGNLYLPDKEQSEDHEDK